MTRLVATGLLLLVYLLAVGSWTAWDALAGLCVGSLALHRFREFVLPGAGDAGPGLRARLLGTGRLTLFLAADFARGTATVIRSAWAGAARPGFVEVHVGERAPRALELAAFLETLSPDLFLADLDLERGVLVFHSCDARDPAAIQRRYERLHDAYVAPLFAASREATTKE